jgi:hypothetical protein
MQTRMPPPNQHIPHRKNAAEWLMWLALYPIALVMRLFTKTPT